MQQDAFAAFDRVFIINLASRDDRRRDMAQELAQCGASVDGHAVAWVAAVQPSEAGEYDSIGAQGCFLSHVRALERALAEGAQSLLILEDDASFSEDFATQMQGIAKQPWDLLYGGSVPYRSNFKPVPGLNTLDPQLGMQCAHFVALRGVNTIQAVRDYLTTMHTRKRGDPRGGPMHVDGAYSWFRKDNPQVHAVLAHPHVATQRASRSDITPGALDRFALTRAALNLWRKMKSEA